MWSRTRASGAGGMHARERTRAAQAEPDRMSPETVICFGGQRLGAPGRRATEPSVMLNLLPWQGQLMVPSATLLTVQPWWVQIAEKALKSPASGWVTTTFWSLKILPPPTGMSEVLASSSPAGAELPASAGSALRVAGVGVDRRRPAVLTAARQQRGRARGAGGQHRRRRVEAVSCRDSERAEEPEGRGQPDDRERGEDELRRRPAAASRAAAPSGAAASWH